MTQNSMVIDLGKLGPVEAQPWSVTAFSVADVYEGMHLVHGHEVRDAVGELADGVAAVVGEGLGGVSVLPAALVFEYLGKVPVVERAVRLDARVTKLIDHVLVEVQPFGVRSTCTLREDPRPCDGEAAGLEADLLHEGDVLLVEMEVVVGDVAGVSVEGLA